MRLANPWALTALLILPFLLYWGMGVKRRAAISFSSLALLPKSRGWRGRLAHLPLFLRLAALALIIIAIARPQAGMEKIQEVNKGIAIEMVVDRSGSMGQNMEFDGSDLSRLAVVKKVFGEFVNGSGKLPGRPNDLIGLITFARYADTICPLTLAHAPLNSFLDTIKLVGQKSPENRTSIGDAIALAAARLKTAEQSLAQQSKNRAGNYTIKSKIIILLTDGGNNAGKRLPDEAAELAAKWGIKIYTIGVGGDDVVKVKTLFGTQMVRTGNGVDRKSLARLAERTGGIFRMAGDAKALRSVYKEIDKLEKSEVTSVRFLDYKEYFFNFALAAFILLISELILRCTIFRKIP
jgi:Ca-activated chloride channel family protein